MQQQDKSFQVYSNEQQTNLFKSKRKSSYDWLPCTLCIIRNNWQPYSWYHLMTKQTKTQTEDKVDFSIAERMEWHSSHRWMWSTYRVLFTIRSNHSWFCIMSCRLFTIKRTDLMKLFVVINLPWLMVSATVGSLVGIIYLDTNVNKTK